MTSSGPGIIEAASLSERAGKVALIATRHADEVDVEARFPQEAVAALKGHRLLGAAVPVHLGGEGASVRELANVCAVLGAACASTAMIFAMHQIKMLSLIAHGQDLAWHRSLIRQAAMDQLLFASSTTEAGVGGDVRNSICAIEREGESFTLEKDAPIISYAQQADAMMITARRDREARSSDQVLTVLIKGQFTLQPTSVWDALGMRGTCSDGWVVKGRGSVEQILPTPFGEISAKTMRATSRLLWSSLWYGIAADAVARARAFVEAGRLQDPAALHIAAARLSEAVRRVQEVRASLLDGLNRYEAAYSGSLGSVETNAALENLKISTSRGVLDVIDHAMLVSGVMGYKNGTPFSLGRHLRDAHSARIMISNDRIQSEMANLVLASQPAAPPADKDPVRLDFP